MIDIETLKEIGKLKGIKNLGYIEKDYIQEILLLIIYRNFNFLVFKGGTCLYKFYRLDRFSEDLDFSAIQDFNIDNFLGVIKNGLRRFNITANKISHKNVYDSILIKIRVEGILYSGSSTSLCTVRIDINTKSEVLAHHTINLKSLYSDIPSFDVIIMPKEEILAEKVRAIMMRTKARDIYDLWFLIKQNTKIDFNLIKQKLDYYGKEFTFDKFKKYLNIKKNIWQTELSSLIPIVPDFREAKRLIIEKFEKELNP